MDLEARSLWEDTAQVLMEFPVFEGVKDVDIAIIGGGITGLTAAMLLSQAGKNVLLLEAKTIGLGTTGNSTGNLYSVVDEHLSVLRNKWNADVMKAVVSSRAAAVSLIENTINRYAIDCDFHRQPFTLFAEHLTKEVETFIEDEYDALREAGLNPVILDDAGLPYQTKRALQIKDQAQFHPLRYVRQLASMISEKCEIYENSRVTELDEEKGILKTEKGQIKANHILMATHTPVGNYLIQTLLAPYREFGVAAPLNDPVFPGGIYWGLNDPKHSVRSFRNNGQNYVMAIGDRFKTGQHEDTEKYVSGLKSYLTERLPVSDLSYFWGGQQYRSADGLPYIGKHGERVYFMTGFAADGLTYGTLAAMIVSDQILGKSNSWEELYKVGRFTPVRSAKNFIVENIDVAVQYLKDVPWNVDPEFLSEIKPGEGKVISLDHEKVAVYKDPDWRLHIVSAVCTHMKCVVNWNQSEKTWDCPCHGSRFDVDGKVIEGPALQDLPVKKE
ncbi:FAD-dependent oxidoreductase [Fluviicola chungangensis]|uniref:FAD-dependent oxidoreductase n=1 Tax=Fluviicola chungangensis TaxID=2597671 RepID=A0A556MQ77_9FLAO|nr:FAD-dependent oxidoreductase [Fluviicola chungangensis]TSJ42070.1 FAD-dependent oxidoreductase [Fluviicola chungangensis]